MVCRFLFAQAPGAGSNTAFADIAFNDLSFDSSFSYSANNCTHISERTWLRWRGMASRRPHRLHWAACGPGMVNSIWKIGTARTINLDGKASPEGHFDSGTTAPIAGFLVSTPFPKYSSRLWCW